MIQLASGDAEITWEIDGLETGSTLTTAVGVSDDAEGLTRATAQLVQVGRDLRDNGVPSTRPFQKAAQGLLSVLNGRVPSLRIETEQDEVTISTPVLTIVPVLEPKKLVDLGPTRGAVEGRVQVISNRGSLRFSLFDVANDKAVSCYLQPGQENLMRDAWGRLAIVEGMVRRDPATGRPTTIRQVSAVQLREEGVPNAWRSAAGVLRRMDDEPAEATIRRLRDA